MSSFMSFSAFFGTFLFLFLFSVLIPTEVSGAKIIRAGSKDWSAVDWEKLERDWEDGDDEDFLKHEDQVLFEEIERRKLSQQHKRQKRGKGKHKRDTLQDDMARLERMTPDEIREMANRNGGTIVGNGEGMPGIDLDGGSVDDTKPLMLFVELVGKPTRSFLDSLPFDGWANNEEGLWTKSVTNMLATMYRDLLQTGGITVTCYDIGSNKLLISSPKGWLSKEITSFFLDREEIKSITVDGVSKLARGGEEL